VLAENHPGLNPLDAPVLTDLRQWVIDLDEISTTIAEVQPKEKLEAIQMAWHEIYKETERRRL